MLYEVITSTTVICFVSFFVRLVDFCAPYNDWLSNGLVTFIEYHVRDVDCIRAVHRSKRHRKTVSTAPRHVARSDLVRFAVGQYAVIISKFFGRNNFV